MSEAISVKCPQCGASLKLKNESAAGKRVPCPKCKKPFVVKVPQADDEPDFASDSEPDDEFALPSERSAAALTPGRAPAKSGRSKPKSAGAKKQPPASGNGMKILVVTGSVLVGLGLIGGVGYLVARSLSSPEKKIADATSPGRADSRPPSDAERKAQLAEQADKLAQCKGNLQQLGQAMISYNQRQNRLPGAAIRDESGKPLLSWRVALLPDLNQHKLYSEFHLDEPWDSENNKPLLAKMPSLFSSAAKNTAPGTTSYLAITGPGGTFERVKPLTITEIYDGMSNTVVIVEASDSLAVPWTKPDDYVYVAENPMQGLLGQHPGGFLALACDGVVHFISESFDPKILVALFTCGGGEPIPRGTFD
jgi:hypothetical protein